MSSLDSNPLVFRNWRHFVAFGFGSGLAPRAPGTAGTLVAVPLYLGMAGTPAWLYGTAVTAAFALGVWLCDSVARDLGVHDHGGIVFDEFVGYWVTMFLLPPTWGGVLGGFGATGISVEALESCSMMSRLGWPRAWRCTRSVWWRAADDWARVPGGGPATSCWCATIGSSSRASTLAPGTYRPASRSALTTRHRGAGVSAGQRRRSTTLMAARKPARSRCPRHRRRAGRRDCPAPRRRADPAPCRLHSGIRSGHPAAGRPSASRP
jgi:phosphatidylglycerophosphatase A